MVDKKSPDVEPQSDNESPNDDEPNICVWCRKPTILRYLAEEPVCLQCYQMLVNAGVSEDEIFSKTSLKKRE